MDSKNKISIITNIEVNFNQNNLVVKPNNTINNINLNTNIPRPTTMKKIAPTAFNLPISQISTNNSPNLILSMNPINLKNSDINKNRNLQSGQLFNEHKIVIRDSRKKDAETQTEDIFFKM